MEQRLHMFFVTPNALSLSNIVDNHVTNFFAAVLEGQKILSHCGGSYFRKMFMLCDGEHFCLS